MTSTEAIELIALLGHEDKRVRATISQTLINQGKRIVPLLEKARNETQGIAHQEITAILTWFGEQSSNQTQRQNRVIVTSK